MSHPSRSIFRKVSAAAMLGAAIGAIAAISSPAQARVFVGLGFGVPFYGPAFVPPPYYYPPPVYYAPPPVYYAPQPAYTPAPAQMRAPGQQTCRADPYVCPMERAVASGSACYCLGNDSQRVWGRAN